MPNTTVRGATCDFCATGDFWTLKRDSCIKRYPSGCVPKPGPGNHAGFFIARTRGTPDDGFRSPAAAGREARKAATPRMPHPSHLVGRGRERTRQQAVGGAHDCARQGAPRRPLLLRFVEALNTPVVAPVMGLFGGRRDSLFVNPSKSMTKAPCKFHLLH